MESSTGSTKEYQEGNDESSIVEPAQVAVVMVPFPGHGHLNVFLQLSCMLSWYSIPVHYLSSAIHIRQAKARVNGLDPSDVANIRFHDIPTPPFASPPPDPNSSNKFPSQLQPAFDATLQQRGPIGDYMRDLSSKYKRLVVIHDLVMAYVVQDVALISNAESYALHCISAFSQATFVWEKLGLPFPIKFAKELPALKNSATEEIVCFVAFQSEAMQFRSGDIYNTCRVIEAPFLDLLAKEEVAGDRKSWVVGPILPQKTLSSTHKSDTQHKCLKWLDKQEPRSVIYVAFGSTTTLSDEEIKELALGLEQSKQKFIWVLRDGDKGFEERVEGVGMVVRDWAPQPQILAHLSTGGYLSHCGWNSCIESIAMGVPIAAWPMHSEQPRNTLLITEILKIGIVVRDWDDREQPVKATTIANAIQRLMASEEGDETRRRAQELAAAVGQATSEGGVSRLDLDSFVAHITRQDDALPA
ncbi:zeatin O-glucosyltransferase-like [Dorcoceras hygrometricum]|uniref:Glycosyltransferase n=1 Tax=Dorcoceras hygrometricum TaxID=472368 RepID=A0A2Z7BRU0_9LAMI|nr:zeatin O-glucosyltransferase-like [Dorcoceras hygrometricum]